MMTDQETGHHSSIGGLPGGLAGLTVGFMATTPFESNAATDKRTESHKRSFDRLRLDGQFLCVTLAYFCSSAID